MDEYVILLLTLLFYGNAFAENLCNNFWSIACSTFFLLGYVYDGLPQYPQPHRIVGFCNYVPRIMNNTDLCPGSGLDPDGSYVTEELLLLVNPQISLFLVILQWLPPLIGVTLAYYLWSSRCRSELKISE